MGCCKNKTESEKILAKYSILQHARWITPEEIIIINEWDRTKQFPIQSVFELYNDIYTIKVAECNCPSKALELGNTLSMQVQYQITYSTE